MLNKALLKSIMVANNDTAQNLSKEMNISEQTFSYKINEKDGKEFGASEIGFFIRRYNLDPNKLVEVFFNQKVS